MAPLAVSETHTFPGHDYILDRRLLHFSILDRLHRTSILERDTGLPDQEEYLQNVHVPSGAHLLVVGPRKTVNLQRPATVLYPALGIHQEGTKSQADIATIHRRRLVGGQENQGKGEDLPDLPQSEKKQEEAAQKCNLPHALYRIPSTMAHVHLHHLGLSQAMNRCLIIPP